MLTLFLVLAACGSKQAPTPVQETTTTEEELMALGYRQPEAVYEAIWPLPADPPVLSWDLTRVGDHLVVSYQVDNPGDQAIWLFDRLQGMGARLTDPFQTFAEGEKAHPEDANAIYVGNAQHAYTARLFRGFGLIPSCKLLTPSISARRVGPSERVLGSAQVALPLRSTDPVYAWLPLVSSVQAVELEIGWTVDNVVLESLYADGGFLPLEPQVGFFTQRWLRAAPRPLPL